MMSRSPQPMGFLLMGFPRQWLISLALVTGMAPIFVARAQQLVTLRSQSPLLELKLMVKAGSAHDPAGREGLAYLTARMLLEGGFGDPEAPVTKEKLAEITRPWGELAMPRVRVGKETTTFSATVPREVYEEFLRQVWGPMFTRPLFVADELERLRKEVSVFVSSELRYENAERLGLEVLDQEVLGGGYAHPVEGTDSGLARATRDDVVGFYRTHYRPDRVAVAVTTDTPRAGGQARRAVARIGGGPGKKAERGARPAGAPLPDAESNPKIRSGRHVLLVVQPNAIATGIHAGFPFPVTRTHPDYWPLFVANIFFGTHRDNFGRLYNAIRGDRGYNYGNYSYLEWVDQRFRYLFPPPTTPRSRQYFSIWIRPVGHQYAYHLMKALTWELENFIRRGMAPEQVELAKQKARILYLNLAETGDRLLGYRLDDWFNGTLEGGYMETYLAQIDGVTHKRVNAAIHRHLQARHLRYVVITDEATARKLQADLPTGKDAQGKPPAGYQIEAVEKDGVKIWQIPEKKLEILRMDKVWEEHPLNIGAKNIRLVFARELFK